MTADRMLEILEQHIAQQPMLTFDSLEELDAHTYARIVARRGPEAAQAWLDQVTAKRADSRRRQAAAARRAPAKAGDAKSKPRRRLVRELQDPLF